MLRFGVDSTAQPVIQTTDLGRDFRTFSRRPGLGGALRDLLRVGGDTLTALDSLSLSVQRGERIALIGPNGAGKSTTIKLATGILHPTRGQIRVLGLDPSRQRKTLARQIGVVFGQRTALWWDLAVQEAFTLLASVYRVSEQDKRARMERFDSVLGIGSLLQTPVRELSLGQRMRCDLAASLLHAPPLLFLDEPTIGLDVAVQQRIRDFLRDENASQGTTIVLTTHDVGDVEALCERVVLLDRGRVVADAPTDALADKLGGEGDLRARLARVYAEREDSESGA